MRIVLTLIVAFFSISSNILAQSDFKTLDEKTYDYYLKGDYKNLKKTADTLLSQGIDYYFLRTRLGITAFNKGRYAESTEDFIKALEFNSYDTISTRYIYYNYLFSGRRNDAFLFSKSISPEQKTALMVSEEKKINNNIFAGATFTSFNQETAISTSLYRESLESAYSLYAGIEAHFGSMYTGTFAFTSFTKTGILNSSEYQSGTGFTFTQAQIYGKLSAAIFPGWEVSLFAASAIYTTTQSTNKLIKENNLGAGIAKNWWRIRTGAEFSVSNFSNSRQYREDAYITWLPQGNLNFYLTAGGMFQYDMNWGSSYQLNQEAGYRITDNLWSETGIIMGNSFLYARNQGYTINNSFLIPSLTVYNNIIVPLKKIRLTLSPYFARYQNYSWNISSYTRTNHATINSFGAAIKINFNQR